MCPFQDTYQFTVFLSSMYYMYDYLCFCILIFKWFVLLPLERHSKSAWSRRDVDRKSGEYFIGTYIPYGEISVNDQDSKIYLTFKLIYF